MPNAAELFIELTDKISPPLNFFVELLLRTGNPEGFEIYNELNPKEVEVEIEDIFEISTDMLYLIKESSVFFLAGMLDERALNALIEMIRDKDVELKREASLLLRMLLNQGVLPESFIKRHLFFTAERLSHNNEIVFRVVNSLINLLKSDKPSVRRWTVVALGTRKDLCVVEHLIGMLDDEDSVVRRKAIINLGMIGNTLAVEPLIARLERDNIENKSYIANSLGLIGDPRAVEPLIKIIEDNSSDLDSAIHAIGMIGSQKAIEFLIRLFENSKDIGIRVLAAGSLAERGNQNAMKFLEKCLYDSDPDVRLSVAYLLGGLRNPITINTMIEFLKNQEIATYFFEDETEKEPEGWKLEHRILGEIFHEYPDTVKNALLNAIGKGKLDEDNAIKVLTWANIRNAKAYLQYLLKKKDKTFSHISFLSSDDANKIPECCKSNLKIGDEAIAILNENNEKESIHAISCLSVKAAYWS